MTSTDKRLIWTLNLQKHKHALSFMRGKSSLKSMEIFTICVCRVPFLANKQSGTYN